LSPRALLEAASANIFHAPCGTRTGALEFKRWIAKKIKEERMDVFKTISERRSIRAYKNMEVEEDKLRTVLEAARLAPSASNRQEWKFVVVRDPEKRAKIVGTTYGQRWVGEAPVLIVACATEGKSIMTCGQTTHTVDVSIACTMMMLEAWEQGLGTCWLGTFNEGDVKKLLDIPVHMRVVTVMPLGYPSDTPPARPRKAFDQVVSFERYR
jgi:nitroreductase